jgi:hypothetical protein
MHSIEYWRSAPLDEFLKLMRGRHELTWYAIGKGIDRAESTACHILSGKRRRVPDDTRENLAQFAVKLEQREVAR